MVRRDPRTLCLHQPIQDDIRHLKLLHELYRRKPHLLRAVLCHDVENPVRSLIGQHIDIFHIPLVALIRIAENYRKAVLPARLVNPSGHIGKIDIGNVRDNQSDGLAPLFYQTDRELVRAVMHLLRRVENPFFGFIRNLMGFSVKNQGDRCHRKTRGNRDILNRRPHEAPPALPKPFSIKSI